MIRCHSISKTYGKGGQSETVLTEVNLHIRAGECCLLMGPSGSGKTTLLSIIGCLSSPTAGGLALHDEKVNFADKAHLAALRRKSIGFVFQHAQLLPFVSAAANVELVAHNAGLDAHTASARAGELLARVGMDRFSHKRPGHLSGGQRQRVAIARALVNRPRIILADEPTAALDWHNGQAVIELLAGVARETSAALVVVTHDHRLETWFDRILEISNGRIANNP